VNDGVTSTRILWRSDELESVERFTGRAWRGGWRLQGLVVLPIDGEPAEIRYGVDLDSGWRTRHAEIAIDHHGGGRAIRFAADGAGGWTVDGATAEPLDGCLDLDLGFTPATNTLQIRRLGLKVGERRSLPVAWLSFPELIVQPLTETYTHLGSARWRYQSDDFSAELVVDPDGYVLRYGDDLWRAVAHQRPAPPRATGRSRTS
jgi:hypothetical protein